MGPVRCPCWQLVDRSFDVRILGSGARRAIGRSPHAASRAASISRPRIRWLPYRLALRRTARAPLQPNPRPWCFIGRWTPRPPPTRPLPPTRPSPRASRPTSTARSRSSCRARPTGCSRSRCASSATAATPRRPPRTRSSGRIGRWAAIDAGRIRELRLRPWLTTIVVNVCRNRTRVRRVRTTELGFEPGAEPAADPVARRDVRDAWASLLATLPPAQRIAIVLRHVDGLSYAEMAEALGKPEGTLKAQVHRGLATLRDAPRRRAATTARR